MDPFVGGGSSFFYLRPQTAILSDLNSDLIDLYAAVRSRPRKLTKRLVHYHYAHNERFFYKVRSNKPHDPIQRSAWLLYLNRTCWNGLFRVNLRGQFNVPIGTKKKVFAGIAELDDAGEALQRATLLTSDFESVVDCAARGDLIFADPPYFEKESNVRFLKYNSSVFSWEDQVRLQAALLRAKHRGAICFVTNANHRSLIDLCGARHMSPCHSENMTEFIPRDDSEFVAIRSPETAEHDPEYRELGRFPTRAKAEEFLAEYEESIPS